MSLRAHVFIVVLNSVVGRLRMVWFHGPMHVLHWRHVSLVRMHDVIEHFVLSAVVKDIRRQHGLQVTVRCLVPELVKKETFCE